MFDCINTVGMRVCVRAFHRCRCRWMDPHAHGVWHFQHTRNDERRIPREEESPRTQGGANEQEGRNTKCLDSRQSIQSHTRTHTTQRQVEKLLTQMVEEYKDLGHDEGAATVEDLFESKRVRVVREGGSGGRMGCR